MWATAPENVEEGLKNSLDYVTTPDLVVGAVIARGQKHKWYNVTSNVAQVGTMK